MFVRGCAFATTVFMKMAAVMTILTVLGGVALIKGDNENSLCPAPLMTRPWISATEILNVTVQWGMDPNLTCHSHHSCHPEFTDQDSPMGPQLMPVEIQEGTALSFDSVLVGRNWILPIRPFEVSNEGFLSCDMKGGKPVVSVATNESIAVNASFLSPGVHYFIVNEPGDVLARCELGLRVNVTVKAIRCSSADGVVCSARGLCLTQYGQPDYTCYCCGKYTGDNCETLDSCPCQNGGRCLNETFQQETPLCACRLGYRGPLCEERVTNMCVVITCNNSGTCTGNDTHFQCACPPGFTGSHCEVNVNECESNPCQNGLCVDDVNGYKCFCRPGYHGRQCQLDYNECASGPCQNGGFCQDRQDNFTCHCHPGFKGSDCSIKVHVCASLKPCLNRAQCHEMTYNYKCTCAAGYVGVHCEVDVDDCAGDPCMNGGTCIDRVADYTCLCHEMHAGPNCQYPLDVFGPMIDIRDPGEGGAEARAFHVRNMYVVTATLSCAVVVVLGVLIACYCRVHSSRPVTLLKRQNYRRHRDETARPVDVSSVTNPRLSVDAIWEASSLNYDVTQLGSPARQRTDLLKNRDV